MTEEITVEQLKERIDTMSDEELVAMQTDIENDVDGFAQHVGLLAAADFLTALLLEMGERKLIDLDDPKSGAGETTSSSPRSSSRVLIYLSSSIIRLELQPPEVPRNYRPSGNRKQRRAAAKREKMSAQRSSR